MFFHGFVKKDQTSVTTVSMAFPTVDTDGEAQTITVAPTVDVYSDDDFTTLIQTDTAVTLVTADSLAAGVLYTFELTLSNLTAGNTYTVVVTYSATTVKYEIFKFVAY
jgi:hypothetical protein